MPTALALIAGQAAAVDLTCGMRDAACLGGCAQTNVQFTVNPAQFADPVSPRDPPRRQVTTVTVGNSTFTAQPILLSGGIVGFDDGTGHRLMIVQPDGAARLTLQIQDRVLIGHCDKD
ncbi:hypothetical protein N9V68_00420 [Octadecabacter sp.]|nr:hypothetical protein [Octadecabacter sp.]